MGTEPIGLSRDLAPRGVMRVRTGQADLAIWRSQRGVVSAWGNRCPHRGMRLSHGFVRGESLACAYHGWHYNGSGHCHYIPAHPELEPPNTIQAVIHSVVDTGGVLWVNTSDTATPVPLPDNLAAVRSITIEGYIEPVEAAFIQLAKVSGIIADMTMQRISDSPRVLSFSTDKHENAIIVLFQQAYKASITCHVLASAAYTADELIAVSRWCESVRRQAENVSTAGLIS